MFASSPRHLNLAFVIACALSLMVGCKPAPNKSNSYGSRRAPTGGSSGLRTAPQTGTATQATVAGGTKQWGEITSSAGDSGFWQAIYNSYYTVISALPVGEELGYVSSQSGQATGIRFWGDAVTMSGLASGSGTFDRSTLTLHLEIFDDKTGSGALPITRAISSGETTFIDAGGTIQGSQVNLYFSDTYGTIYLNGTINGQIFSGTVLYGDGYQQNTLGNFSVATCGFFRCN